MDNMLKIIVCGGRDYADVAKVTRTLDALRTPMPIVLICGMCRGADMAAYGWAKARGLQVDCYPAEWEKYGRSAGPIRNQRMIDAGRPDLVIAFPGGDGTQDMIRRAMKAGIEVLKID